MNPVIITDSREQAPLRFSLFPSEVATLSTGDYSVRGLEHVLTIQRKSIEDLIGSLTTGRKRFQREIQRMLAYRSRTLLIIGPGVDPGDLIKRHSYRSLAKPQSILASLASIEAKGIAIKTVSSPDEAAHWIETLAFYAWRSAQITAGNPKPTTPPELLERLTA